MEDLAWQNNNMEPLKVVQYKYEEKEFNTLVMEAFNRLTEGDTITVVTNDKTISVPSGGLMVFSPMLRRAVGSLTQQQEVVIMIPESSSSSFIHLVNILSEGGTEIQVGDVNTTELLVTANSLGIDLTNFDYVPSVKKDKIKKEAVIEESMDTAESGAKVAKNKKGKAIESKGKRKNISKDIKKKENTTTRNTDIKQENQNSNETLALKATQFHNDESYNNKKNNEIGEDLSKKENKDSNSKIITDTLKKELRPSKDYSSEDTFNEDQYSDDDFYDEYEAEDEKQFQKNLENSLNNSMKPNSVTDSKESFLGSKSDAKMDMSNSMKQAHPPPPLNTNQLNKPAQPKQGGLWAMSTNRQQNQSSAMTNSVPAPLPRAPLPAPTSQPDQFPAHKPTPPNPAPPRGQLNPTNLQALVDRYASRVGNTVGPPHPQPVGPPPPHQPVGPHPPPSPILPSASQTNRFAQQGSGSPMIAPPQGSPKTPSGPLNSSFTFQVPQNSPHTPANNPQSIPRPATQGQINSLTVPQFLNAPNNPLGPVSNPQTPPAGLGLTCQLCSKLSSGVGLLWQHYAARHFLTDLRAHVLPTDLANKHCSVCSSQFKSVQNLLIHMGTVHNKVEDVMIAKGLQPIKKKRGHGMGQGGA